MDGAGSQGSCMVASHLPCRPYQSCLGIAALVMSSSCQTLDKQHLIARSYIFEKNVHRERKTFVV